MPNGYSDDIRETHEGELVSISPLVVNLGWDGRDRKEETVEGGIWVKLDSSKTVSRPSGDKALEREQAKAQAEALQSEAQALTQAPYFPCFAQEIRDAVTRVAQRQYLFHGPRDFGELATDELRGWSAGSKTVLEAAREVEADAKALHVRQAGGEVLVDFRAKHRRGGMSGNGDGWVICSDGSRRTHDDDDVSRYKSDGTYHWLRVETDELALSWSCDSMRDMDGGSEFVVAKLPVGGLTPGQKDAVVRIETEIGASLGAFGLDPEINATKTRRLEAIRTALGSVRLLNTELFLRERGQFLLKSVFSLTGEAVYDEHVRMGSVDRVVRDNRPFDQSCDNREAQLVQAIRADDGVLEFLAYKKGGQMNLRMRWRPLREDENVPATQPVAAVAERKLTAEEVRRQLAGLSRR